MGRVLVLYIQVSRFFRSNIHYTFMPVSIPCGLATCACIYLQVSVFSPSDFCPRAFLFSVKKYFECAENLHIYLLNFFQKYFLSSKSLASLSAIVFTNVTEGSIMKQPNLNYIAGNSPHIAPLPDCETKAFFSALLASMKELSEEERNNNSFCLSAGGA